MSKAGDRYSLDMLTRLRDAQMIDGDAAPIVSELSHGPAILDGRARAGLTGIAFSALRKTRQSPSAPPG